MRTLARLLAGSIFLALAGTAAHAETITDLDLGMLPKEHVSIPEQDVNSVVVLVSDENGWSGADETLADTLLSRGTAVIGLDFQHYMKALNADTGDCVYMISDIESVAQQIQRMSGSAAYEAPLLAGRGTGGALVLAMMAQSPVATIGGAIAVDPTAAIPLKKLLCTPARKVSTDAGVEIGLTDGKLPAPIDITFTPAASADGKRHTAELIADHPDIARNDSAYDAAKTLQDAVLSKLDVMSNAGSPLGLPLTILDAKPTRGVMAVIYSGDGGWRDLDKETAEILQQQGVPVVGVDSLRYFWSKRTPEETAADLARIIQAYRQKWQVNKVLLVGYSFGADILPATYNLLPEKDRQSVVQVTLLALTHSVDYEISVTGWFGMAGSGENGDPVDDIAKIDPKLVQCVYGTDETEDACPTLTAKGIEVIPIEGGHHFDEDYPALAKRILDALDRRLKG